MGVGTHRDGPPARSGAICSDPIPHRVTRRDERGDVRDGPALHERAAGARREVGEIRDPPQGLVLRVDGAGCLEPVAPAHRGRSDDEIEQHRRLGGRTRDEGEETGVARRDARWSQLVGEDPQCLLAADTLGGDRRTRPLLQLGERPRVVEGKRVELQATPGVVEHRIREALDVVVPSVHDPEYRADQTGSHPARRAEWRIGSCCSDPMCATSGRDRDVLRRQRSPCSALPVSRAGWLERGREPRPFPKTRTGSAAGAARFSRARQGVGDMSLRPRLAGSRLTLFRHPF